MTTVITTYSTLKECNFRNDIYLNLINIGVIHGDKHLNAQSITTTLTELKHSPSGPTSTPPSMKTVLYLRQLCLSRYLPDQNITSAAPEMNRGGK